MMDDRFKALQFEDHEGLRALEGQRPRNQSSLSENVTQEAKEHLQPPVEPERSEATEILQPAIKYVT